jgi:hypothetical protein
LSSLYKSQTLLEIIVNEQQSLDERMHGAGESLLTQQIGVYAARSAHAQIMATAAYQPFKFVAEVDDALKCLICLEVANDPLQHEGCGKLFCKECLEKPNCRGEGNYYTDIKSK